MATHTHHRHRNASELTPLTPIRRCREDSEEEFQPCAPNQYALTLIFLCVFVGDMARGILFPTLWLFVQQLGVSALLSCVVLCCDVCFPTTPLHSQVLLHSLPLPLPPLRGTRCTKEWWWPPSPWAASSPVLCWAPSPSSTGTCPCWCWPTASSRWAVWATRWQTRCHTWCWRRWSSALAPAREYECEAVQHSYSIQCMCVYIVLIPCVHTFLVLRRLMR